MGIGKGKGALVGELNKVLYLSVTINVLVKVK